MATEQSGMRQLLARRPLVSFFVLAYAFSWITLIPYILSQWNILPNNEAFALFQTLNTFLGPALAGYIMQRVVGGKDATRNLWRRLIQVKVGLKWYLFILLVLPAVLFLGMIVLSGGQPGFHGLSGSFVVQYLVYFIIIFFVGGPLGEEIGWRGFALPRMQSKYGALNASLLIGVLWALWHLPQFLTTAQRGGPGTSISIFYINLPIFIMMCVADAIIVTWEFNHTRGSIFIAVLHHASIDAFTVLANNATAPILTKTDLSPLIGLWIPALLILVFTRGRLGYQQNREVAREQPYPASI